MANASDRSNVHSSAAARPLSARAAGPLAGEARIPGDKSISHRALILGALAVGETRITGLLEGADVLATAAAMRAFGAGVVKDEAGWSVHGVGVGGLGEPADVLDFGNSGTGARLVMGMMATTPIMAVFTGDDSLRRRPMGRVLEPLALFGAEARSREGGRMPLALTGAREPMPIDHQVTLASAQVKSALLLAALNAPGRSRIAQAALTRDHTEKMLAAFGAEIAVEPLDAGGEAITITGEAELKPAPVEVPRDPSSAAFPLVAGLIVPGSQVTIPKVLLNPRRAALIEALRGMGATIEIANRHTSGGEEIGDLAVRACPLKGFEVPPEWAPSMIDEYPVMAVAAAFAQGRTVMRGLEELRVKESDRLAAMAAGLKAIGVAVEELPDGLVIEGRSGEVPGGATVATHMDHRIAMSFLVAGLATKAPVTVDDAAMIATSFPAFENLMRGLGAEFEA